MAQQALTDKNEEPVAVAHQGVFDEKKKIFPVLVCMWLLFSAVLGVTQRAFSGGGSYVQYLPIFKSPGVWKEVGPGSATGEGISMSPALALFPSLAIAPNEIPYVAWQESDVSSEIFVRRWNGMDAWEEVGVGSATDGGISNNDGASESPALAIALDGTPYIAWQDTSSGNLEIYVRRWDGNAWSEVGVGSATGGGISNSSSDSEAPALAISADGVVFIAWSETSSGNSDIYTLQWKGSDWVEVGDGSASDGGISDNPGFSIYPSVAVAPDGTPFVVWTDFTTLNWEIYILRYLR